ncbi:polyprenyl synthetase family protein [Pseudomonas viridiflava]|nr:polyprenyl synthetase family protein [Pseudomonas viridiflava]MEE4125177.1 polyprenyl synthetase family protein [Pseudomonas viridiflava]MEE4225210.1 polyprenyl synthetase family protein [Pseudomonas viridiflava]MEE4232828.1 polyprenyl synthetase family protein [Pseudomonas viridiflava]
MTKMEMDASLHSGLIKQLADMRERIEKRLDELLPQEGNERDLVALAMREGTLAPGKRVRPMLLILAAEGLGHSEEASLDLGCAVEMIHAASLVLDDMPCMDNAQLRRGRPTVHLKFGQDVAILAAIALLSRAFGVVAAIKDVPPANRTRIVEILADTVGMQGLVRGQYQDLREGQHSRCAEEIALTNRLKTGVLFGAIMDMAWLISSDDERVRLELQGFATELGQAFQLYDDLQDDAFDNAKDQGKDKGKSTFVSLYGQQKVAEQLHAHLSRADKHLHQAYGDAQAISPYLKLVFFKAL